MARGDDFIGGIEDLANVAFTPAKLAAGVLNNGITTAGSTVNNTVISGSNYFTLCLL